MSIAIFSNESYWRLVWARTELPPFVPRWTHRNNRQRKSDRRYIQAYSRASPRLAGRDNGGKRFTVWTGFEEFQSLKGRVGPCLKL